MLHDQPGNDRASISFLWQCNRISIYWSLPLTRVVIFHQVSLLVNHSRWEILDYFGAEYMFFMQTICREYRMKRHVAFSSLASFEAIPLDYVQVVFHIKCTQLRGCKQWLCIQLVGMLYGTLFNVIYHAKEGLLCSARLCITKYGVLRDYIFS